MVRYLLWMSLLLSMILNASLGSMPVRAQPSPQAQTDFCAPFASFPCQNQVTHQQGAIAAVDISYPQEAGSNVQIFKTPDLAHRVFDQERSAGDLDILGRSEPTSEVGDSGYGYKKTGSPAQNTALPVQYDFVRSCYLVTLNNGNGMRFGGDGSVEYSRESNEFAAKFAQQLDEKLKETPCPSAAGLAKGGGNAGGNKNGGGTGFSFPVTEGEAIGGGGGALLIGLGLLLANKLRGGPVPAGTSSTSVKKPNAKLRVFIPDAPAQSARDYPSVRPTSGTEQLNAPNSIDEPAPPGAVPTTVPEHLIMASGSHKFYWLLALLAVAPLLIIGVFELGRRSSTYFSANSESSTESRMGLKLERMGSDWRFSWNPDAAIILKATKGHLLITDGASRKFLDLDSSDLRGGTIMYTPLTNDVVLRLEVDKANSAETVSESVRIAGSLLPPLAPQLLSPASGGHRGGTGRVAPSVFASPETGDSGERSGVSRPMVNGVPPVEVAKSWQNNSSKTPGRAEQLGTATFPSPMPAVKLQGRDVPASTSTHPVGPASKLDAVSTDLSSATPSTRESVQPSTRLEPAQLIIRKDPLYPPLAREGRFSGFVELHFYIRTDGAVYDVSVVKGNPVLARAAVEAVKTWRYKPARLNGTSIETEGSAFLDFK